MQHITQKRIQLEEGKGLLKHKNSTNAKTKLSSSDLILQFKSCSTIKHYVFIGSLQFHYIPFIKYYMIYINISVKYVEGSKCKYEHEITQASSRRSEFTEMSH